MQSTATFSPHAPIATVGKLKEVENMKVTRKFAEQNQLQDLMMSLLKAHIDNVLEESYDKLQANTVTSQNHLSKGGECA